MKRSEALAPLSRDHHHGLFVAMHLKRATADTAAEARQRFLEFWAHEGDVHFVIEETVLLPAFARRGPHDHEAVVRTLTDHVDLRRRALDVGDASPEQLHELGERLSAHIRHEESVLFPLIETTLDAEELRALGTEITSREQ
ncbi:MAG TPA: hemerythrin domain-containing protein [Solirubrobacter sp.]|nr:hemerythrin domain-containing protein [Solirubrobacter sp.]